MKPALVRRAFGVSVLAAALYAPAQPPTPLPDLIGQYLEAVAGGRTSVDLGAVDLDVVRRDLGRLDPARFPIVDSSLPADRVREYRRRVLTAFALEMAAAGSTRQASSAARLVEWACPYVRSHTPIDDFDRAWQLAALAVIEGGIDSQALQDHVNHALPIFPDEPRLALARGIVEEQVTAPAEIRARSVTAASLARAREAASRAEGERFRASQRAMARFQEASQHEAVHAESLLRSGHVQLLLSHYDAALATWRDLERETRDPALLFLLHLFRGIAYENRGRYDESRQAFGAALALSPGAHSATVRLAALAFRNGQPEEAARLTEALLRDDDPRRDPWWSYYAADWRLYYPRIERVRALLKP